MGTIVPAEAMDIGDEVNRDKLRVRRNICDAQRSYIRPKANVMFPVPSVSMAGGRA